MLIHNQEHVAPGAYAATLQSVRVDVRLSRAYSHGPKPVLPTPRPSCCSGRNVVGRDPRFLAYRGVRTLCHPIFPTSETDHRGLHLSPSFDSL
ncbi:hypothetical protein E4U22_007999 [Claviceps purpurea]|nr:hypothetical protein E4U22_007999 [Claviceps purpurea]